MPLPSWPLPHRSVPGILPAAVILAVMASLPFPAVREDSNAALFTAPVSCQLAAAVSTWYDHDPRPAQASNWAGLVQDPTLRPFADGHNGTDYAVDSVPVLAIAPGVVRETRRDAAGALVVAVDHGAVDGRHQYQSRYVHLRSFAVTPGQTVARGQVLGISGNTGLSSGPHLHLTLLEDGRPIDPYSRYWRGGQAPCPPTS